ncbi:MAG: class I SAM-dependent methyltransferase, partial [Bacteroidota bacterium]
MKKDYQPEPYWSEVAGRIASREDQNIIAGDDEPFYDYKRARFLEMLNEVDFAGRSVLEIGPGPGGNLSFISGKNPTKLVGADISQDMINLATKNLAGKNVELVKTNGTVLPFEDNSFDIVITVTVLQHNTDEEMLRALIKEITRVSKDQVIIFEQTHTSMKGDELCYWRPVPYYQEAFQKNGFSLQETKYSNIYTSYLVCGAIRKLLNPSTREEGEPLNKVSHFLERA